MSWRDRANCLNVIDPGDFFPLGANEMPDHIAAACASCPVREECRDYALTLPEAYGIFGGLTETDRRYLRAGAERRPVGRPRRAEVA